MRRIRTLYAAVAVVFVASVLCGPLIVAQQSPPPAGTGLVSGRVVEGTSDRPVSGAVVMLQRVPGDGRLARLIPQVVADAQGRFVFSDVPDGEYRVRAARPGWFSQSTPPPGVPIPNDSVTLSPGGRADVTVPLWRLAVVSGQVTDESGEPVAGAFVGATRWATVAGRRVLGGAGGGGTTDDRGVFTLLIPPGEYAIAARSMQIRARSGGPDAPIRRFVFEQTFYPGTPSFSSAAQLTLAPGADRRGIDIQLPLRPAVRVAGVLRNTAGAGRTPGRVELVRLSDDLMYSAQVDAQGRFAFEQVAAGHYVLRNGLTAFAARAPSEQNEGWVRAGVEVGDRDIDIEADLHRRLRVSGRVQFDGDGPAPASASITLTREDELIGDVMPPYVPTGADGRFTIDAPPGRYIVSAFVPVRTVPGAPGAAGTGDVWSLRSAIGAGRDTADAPLAVTSDVSDLVLTFTNRPVVLRGTVTARDGRAEPSLVLVFPADESLWADFGPGRRLEAVPPARDGTFEITRLPAGDYLVAAVRGVSDRQSWKHPAFLRELAGRASRVVLREGLARTEALEAMPAPAVSAGLSPPRAPIQTAGSAIVRERADAAMGGATISGRVVAVGTGRPVASARVGTAPNATGTWTYADEDGRFVLAGVPAGRHMLYASRTSYVSAVHGGRHVDDPGTPIAVAGGDHVGGVTIEMVRAAAIGGTVRDQHGEPLVDAQIGLHSYRWHADGRELVQARPSMTLPLLRTDARGTYRVYGLAPGEYVVAVTPTGNAASTVLLTTTADLEAASGERRAGASVARVRARHAPVYYPNAIDPASAQAVTLAAGDDRAIDFQIPLVPMGEVSGVVRSSDGLLPANLSIRLSASDPLAAAGRTRVSSATVDRTAGTFVFQDVPPGRYTLAAESAVLVASAVQAPRLSGSVEVAVNGDLAGVVLDLEPAGTIMGRIDAWPAMADEWRGLRLTLAPLAPVAGASPQRPQATIDAEGRFSFTGVSPGRYRFDTMRPGPANAARPRVASQIAGGQETIDAGLEVRSGGRRDVQVSLTMSEAQVTGLVRDGTGRPTAEPFVVLFARASEAWTPPSRRILAVRPDQNGRYLFADVPSGEYLMATLVDAEPGEWFNPARLARLVSAATEVSVRPDDRLEVDLTMR